MEESLFRQDTTTSTLTLYLGLHKDELAKVRANGMVRPCNIMNEREHCSWLVLHTTGEGAARRAAWGFEELGKEPDASQLLGLCFKFTALGVGHYMMQNTLTTKDWHHFRFYGDLPLLSHAMNGEPLVRVQ